MSTDINARIQVAILVDDMIDTGKTLTLATRTLQDKGVKCVYALISHGNVECLSGAGNS
jgi:ribose-phosphate pyrophosphokinase